VLKLAFLYHIFLWPLSMSVLMLGAILTPACQPNLGLWLAITAGVSFVLSAGASQYAAKASHRWLS
jgi:hypothetical protein